MFHERNLRSSLPGARRDFLWTGEALIVDAGEDACPKTKWLL